MFDQTPLQAALLPLALHNAAHALHVLIDTVAHVPEMDRECAEIEVRGCCRDMRRYVIAVEEVAWRLDPAGQPAKAA